MIQRGLGLKPSFDQFTVSDPILTHFRRAGQYIIDGRNLLCRLDDATGIVCGEERDGLGIFPTLNTLCWCIWAKHVQSHSVGLITTPKGFGGSGGMVDPVSGKGAKGSGLVGMTRRHKRTQGKNTLDHSRWGLIADPTMGGVNRSL
jgi:hypothetical protein